MLLHQKKTFKEIAASKEGIATNLLSSRLKLLASLGMITKRKLPTNKKENIYLLTEKGIDLAPMIMEIVLWSDKHVRAYNPGMNANERDETDKMLIIENCQNDYRAFARNVIN
jgi:DNA-binding HxlR family transcriptional regulator